MLLLVSLLACKPVEETPPDLDALLHAMWQGWDAADDATLAQVAVDLEAVIDEAALAEQAERGNPTRLSQAEINLVPLTHDPDPAAARGIHLLNRFPCADLDLLEAILTYDDQDALYGDYDSYSRAFDADRDAFLDGDADRLTWVADAAASNIATGGYTEVLHGGLRRVPLPDGHPFAEARALYARTFIPEAAITERENVSFEQDYQIEAYLPWAGGDVVHVYAIWRQISMGTLGDMESDVVANITLNNMEGWDRKTAELCEEGLPE